MQWCQTTEQGASIISLWIFLPLLLNTSSSSNPCMILSHSNWFCTFQAHWVLSIPLQSCVGAGSFLHLMTFRPQRVLGLLQSHWGTTSRVTGAVLWDKWPHGKCQEDSEDGGKRTREQWGKQGRTLTISHRRGSDLTAYEVHSPSWIGLFVPLRWSSLFAPIFHWLQPCQEQRSPTGRWWLISNFWRYQSEWMSKEPCYTSTEGSSRADEKELSSNYGPHQWTSFPHLQMPVKGWEKASALGVRLAQIPWSSPATLGLYGLKYWDPQLSSLLYLLNWLSLNLRAQYAISKGFCNQALDSSAALVFVYNMVINVSPLYWLDFLQSPLQNNFCNFQAYNCL